MAAKIFRPAACAEAISGTPAVGDEIPERDDRAAGRGADLNVDLVEARDPAGSGWAHGRSGFFAGLAR